VSLRGPSPIIGHRIAPPTPDIRWDPMCHTALHKLPEIGEAVAIWRSMPQRWSAKESLRRRKYRFSVVSCLQHSPGSRCCWWRPATSQRSRRLRRLRVGPPIHVGRRSLSAGPCVPTLRTRQSTVAFVVTLAAPESGARTGAADRSTQGNLPHWFASWEPSSAVPNARTSRRTPRTAERVGGSAALAKSVIGGPANETRSSSASHHRGAVCAVA
jgi:hypothetical protein